MSSKTESSDLPNGIHNPCEPINSKLFPGEDPVRHDVSGSVMDGLILDVKNPSYTVYKIRWFTLGLFVLYSASNSLQWTQYTIISDIIVRYYGVSSNVVSWTSMVYMLTYVPLIFPGSWLLDKTVSTADYYTK